MIQGITLKSLGKKVLVQEIAGIKNCYLCANVTKRFHLQLGTKRKGINYIVAFFSLCFTSFNLLQKIEVTSIVKELRKVQPPWPDLYISFVVLLNILESCLEFISCITLH